MDLHASLFGLKPVSRWQFGLVRAALGIYLLWHFALLLPYAGELFSRAGTLGDPDLSPLFRLLPSPLWLSDSPAMAATMIGVALVASLALALGWQRHVAAALLLYLWAALFCRNPLIANPSLAYIGLMLVLSLLVPRHEALRLGPVDARKWAFPAGVFTVAWILLATGYTFSGIIKLQSPSWVDGTALLHLLENPLARPGPIRDLLLLMPLPIIQAMTWLSLLGEILFLPLACFRTGRLAVWTLMLGMHLGILTVVDFADLTVAMVLIHLFTFDPAWFPPRADGRRRILFYDGDCGLCTRSVKFLLGEDTGRILQFAPLQGETARDFLPEGLRDTSETATVALARSAAGSGGAATEVLVRSRAILGACVDLGGMWRPAGWLGLAIPQRLADAGYRWIARNRLRFFPGGACALPTANERRQLLP